MRDNQNYQFQTVLDLLEEATSLDVVREFLRRKSLHHTAGSWKDMREKRLLPYLNAYQIDLDELVVLLNSSEECGDQHIFLHHCSAENAVAMMDRARTYATLRANGLVHLIDGADLERRPATPTIVEVRWETADVDVSMVIKVAEVRTRRTLLRERTINSKFVKIYSDEPVRAVNVAKLHRSGFLELRIQSRDNTTKYDQDHSRFLRIINPYFPTAQLGDTSLDTAKDAMWQRREELKDLLRYTDASVIDDEGNKIKAATGSNKANLSDSAAGRSVDYFLNEDENAYCAESNLWFNKSDHLTSPIHVLLNGAPNEFAITKKCSAADYEYVLNQIRQFNR